jgi:hypothetical protein
VEICGFGLICIQRTASLHQLGRSPDAVAAF